MHVIQAYFMIQSIMYHLNTSYIFIAYCDTLHASASAGDPHTCIKCYLQCIRIKFVNIRKYGSD